MSGQVQPTGWNYPHVSLPLNLAVTTQNEAEAIARCPDGVPFAADKGVLDSGSDDAKVEIAFGLITGSEHASG